MDDIRSKQRKPDDSRHIGIVFADGSGKFVDMGKTAAAIKLLKTTEPGEAAGFSEFNTFNKLDSDCCSDSFR